jgi:hypothetical protein
LSDTAKHLIVEQAARTSQFLADVPETEFADAIPTIEAQLGVAFDPQVRLENIHRFLHDDVTDLCELREMLWQEIVICDALRRFVVGSRAFDEAALRQQVEEEWRAELESRERKFRREMKLLRRNVEQEIRQQVSEELEAKLAKRIRCDLTKRLRKEIADELAPQIRKQTIFEVEPRFRRQAEKEMAKQIRSDVIADLQAGLHHSDDEELDELRRQLTPKIEESVREQTIAELTPRIRKDVEREMSHQVITDLRSHDNDPRAERDHHFDEFAAQVQDEVARLRQQITESVRETIRMETEAELVPRLSKMLRSEIIAELKQHIQQRDGDDEQLAQLVDELQSQLRDELRRQTTAEFDELIRQRTDQIREETEKDLRPTLSTEIEADLRQRLADEIEAKVSKRLRREIERELREKVVDDLRREMEETIREKVRVELVPILTEQIREADDTDSQFAELYELICEALGLTSEGFSRAAFADVCRRIAREVLDLRTRFGISGDLLQFILDLQCENAHLDQLHTQTRSLLVRQAQLISELRQSAHTARWRKWADRLYKAITRTTPPANDPAAVRRGIEEYVNAHIE